MDGVSTYLNDTELHAKAPWYRRCSAQSGAVGHDTVLTSALHNGFDDVGVRDFAADAPDADVLVVRAAVPELFE